MILEPISLAMHARDSAGRARTGIRIEILKNEIFKEMPFRDLRWITGRKNGLNRLLVMGHGK